MEFIKSKILIDGHFNQHMSVEDNKSRDGNAASGYFGDQGAQSIHLVALKEVRIFKFLTILKQTYF